MDIPALQEASATAPPQAPLPRSLVWLLTFATGATVANMYYCQPLLGLFARTFHVDDTSVATVVTVTQVGTAFGMGLFVPLGDMLNRRRHIVLTILMGAVALLAAAAAPTLAWLLAASAVVGLCSVVPHLVLPFSAQLAPPRERGRVVGTVTGGLLLGILLARTVSGGIGAWFGWRLMYGGAAGAMLALAAALWRLLPNSAPSYRGGLAGLFRSIARLARTQPTLQEAAITGGMLFGAFSAFWTTLIFLLQRPPYHYGARMAGAFGLAGAAGALAAPAVGRIADRRSPRTTVAAGIMLVLLSFALFALLGLHLWGLALGVVVMDLGVQSAHVSNLTRIYALLPEARSRLNTVYMVTYFLCGSLGSFLGAWAWARAGWGGVCMVGFGMGLVALAGLSLGRRAA